MARKMCGTQVNRVEEAKNDKQAALITSTSSQAKIKLTSESQEAILKMKELREMEVKQQGKGSEEK